MDDSDHVKWLKRLAMKAGFNHRKVIAHKKFHELGDREIDCAIIDRHGKLLIALESVESSPAKPEKKQILKKEGITLWEFPRSDKLKLARQIIATEFLKWVNEKRKQNPQRPLWKRSTPYSQKPQKTRKTTL